jgi:hypothetical protein
MIFDHGCCGRILSSGGGPVVGPRQVYSRKRMLESHAWINRGPSYRDGALRCSFYGARGTYPAPSIDRIELDGSAVMPHG